MDTTVKTPTLRELGYFSESETAAIYGTKRFTLRNWRCKGIGPPFTRVQRNLIAYPIAGVRKDLERRTVKPGKRELTD